MSEYNVFWYSDQHAKHWEGIFASSLPNTVVLGGNRVAYTECTSSGDKPMSPHKDHICVGKANGWPGLRVNDVSWKKHRPYQDCNAAVIPKEEILDAIYHCYQDKWLPLSKGNGIDDGWRDCALCLLLKRHHHTIGKMECDSCPINIDSGNCHTKGSMYSCWCNATGSGSAQALHAADRFANYLLKLHLKVSRDEVNLPYLAVMDFASKYMNKAAGKPEPVEKKKEWKLIETGRIGVNIHSAMKRTETFNIRIMVDSQEIGDIHGEDIIRIYRSSKYRITLYPGCDQTWRVEEYV